MEGNSANNIKPDELKDIYIRLAHFDPTKTDQCGNSILEYLVLDALTTFGMLAVEICNIKEYIKSRFHIEFEEVEVKAAARNLEKKEMISGLENNKQIQSFLSMLKQEGQKAVHYLFV